LAYEEKEVLIDWGIIITLQRNSLRTARKVRWYQG